jgi:hypothetical protein
LTSDSLKPGLHEALLTRRLERLLTQIPDEALLAELAELSDAEASDRMSRHLAGMLARAIERAPEGKRSGEQYASLRRLFNTLRHSLIDRATCVATNRSTPDAYWSHYIDVSRTEEHSQSSAH